MISSLRLFAAVCAALLALAAAADRARRRVFAGPARRHREDRARLPGQAPRSAAGGDGRTGEAPAGRRGRKAQGRRQGQRQDAVQFARRGRARQSEGQRHLRRVLRLQLRLLQARHERHAHADEDRSQAQGGAQGIPGARARLGGSRARRGRRAHAGAAEIPRIPHQAVGRARPCRRRPRLGGGERDRARHGAG